MMNGDLCAMIQKQSKPAESLRVQMHSISSANQASLSEFGKHTRNYRRSRSVNTHGPDQLLA